ncbi:MAG: geranylgeranylglycerol-phosphate geranylgeranyltransferase [Thermoplasmata archaeon]
MDSRLEIIRPLNAAMSAFAVLAGGIVAAGTDVLSSPPTFSLFVAMLVAFLYTGGGNTLNDYYDRLIDRVNHPDRPLPMKRIRPASAWRLSIFLFASGLISSFFIGWPGINHLCLLIALLNMFLLWVYEFSLKRSGLPGNLTISWLTASLFLFGGAAVIPPGTSYEVPVQVLVLSLLAFLASMGRELIKGIEDIEGDTDRRTVPRLIGPKRAGAVASAWILLAVLLSPSPVFPMALFQPLYYIPLMVGADAIFIYSLLVLMRNPGLSSRLTKVAMLLALLAFLAGGLAKVKVGE